MTEPGMSLIELLLRLGCSMVAWMVVYTHCVWLATLRVIGCEAGSDEFWRLLLGFAPVAIGFSLLLGSMNKMPEIARILRLLGVPLLCLLPLAAWPVFTALMSSTLGSAPICGMDSVGWHSWWAPVQLVTLVTITFFVAKAWTSVENETG